MSAPHSSLPARPSLEQLRKQAKDLLRAFRAQDPGAIRRVRTHRTGDTEPILADAQFVIAREHGFESWPKLAQHVEARQPPARVEQLEQMADDLLAGARGDPEALQRLSVRSGTSYNLEQLHVRAFDQVRDVAAPGATADQLTVADARRALAGVYGFGSWVALTTSIEHSADAATAPGNLSPAPLFYRLDPETRTIELLPPVTDSDWDIIVGAIEEMGLARLHAGGQMTDYGMGRIAGLTTLTHLNLDGSQLLTDEGVLRLAAMPQLESLDLSGWHSRVTDRGLGVLRDLPNLLEFRLCWPQRVTDAGVARLAECSRLREINLLGTPTGDGAIAAMEGKKDLRILAAGRLVTDAGLERAHGIPAFRHWQGGDTACALMSWNDGPTRLLVDGPFTDRGVEALEGLDGLFALSLMGGAARYTAAGIRALASLPRLGMLGLDGGHCTDQVMVEVAALPALRKLMAQGAAAGDAGFGALARSGTLEYVWGRDSVNFGSGGLIAMSRMPALRGIALSLRGVDDAALATLPSFPSLRAIVPMDLGDAAFRHVGRCQQLEQIWCMYCRDTGDVATSHLAGLAHLRTYYAGKTRITDESLRTLGTLSSLEELEFWQTAGVSDAGLPFIASLPRLRRVELAGVPKVTRTGVSVFPPGVRVTLG